MRENFFLVFFSLVRLSLDIKDKYIRARLIKKINRLFDVFSDIQRENADVAQCCPDTRALLFVIDEISELIEMFEYLKVINPSPALLAQKNLLSFKLKIFNSLTLTVSNASDPERAIPETEKLNMPKSKKTKSKKGGKVNKEVAGEQIISFVKNNDNGEANTKEITSAFTGQISSRTIQRYITRLVETNKLQKVGEGKAIKYRLV